MENRLKGMLKQLKANETTISMILGSLVVIVTSILLFNYFRQSPVPQITDQSTSTSAGELKTDTEPGDRFAGSLNQESSPTPTAQVTPTAFEGPLPTGHIVREGENLWEIAERYYNSGYNWVDIAAANGLDAPDLLAVGRRLTIPGVAVRESKVVSSDATVLGEGRAIEGGSYTVLAGDTLWDIAIRAYRDGYRWPEIFRENSAVIHDPNQIEVGQRLTIPR